MQPIQNSRVFLIKINNRSLEMKYCFIALLLLVISSCTNSDNPIEPKAMTKVPSHEVLLSLNSKLDSLRALNSIATIEPSEIIAEQCYKHSLYMLEMKKISHDNFEEERLPAIGEESAYKLAFENVGYYNGTEDPATQIFADWMGDEAIKSNLLKTWDRMGAAVVTDSLGNYYTTQIFITLLR